MGKKNRVRTEKSKRDRIELQGIVLEAHPAGMFSVELDSAAESNKTRIVATLSGKLRENFIKILPGDLIMVELSSYDLTRGRIISRLRNSDSSNSK